LLPYLFLFLYLAVLIPSLWMLFTKAGKPGWHALVPGYNLYLWLTLCGKPWWWIVLFLVPGVNLLMLVIMNVNISIVLGERTFKEHLVMTFLPWYKVPQVAFNKALSYKGPIPVKERRRTTLGQWGDAILFAVIVATVARTYTFEAFTIPTPSMEKSLLVGDYLFVSKLSYGPRMPMTPLTFPFTHHTIPVIDKPSFVTWFSQPYRRLPGFGAPQRGDAVVFNFPEGDTVVANFQNQSYYQLVRDHGREKLRDPNFRMMARVDGRDRLLPTGGLLVRPLDKRENYIKRCVGVAGDTLQVIDGVVHINGVPEQFPEFGQYGYETTWKATITQGNLARMRKLLKEQYDVSIDGDLGAGRDDQHVNVALTAGQVEKLTSDNPFFGPLERQVHPKGFQPWYAKLPYFPNHPDYDWTEDNFGPIWIPKAGATIALTEANLPLYRRAITLYEGNTLEVVDGTIRINGEPTSTYTFEQDYYWMMGDNRHRSQDSRFWGFVPHDHVVGKAVLVWFSKDPITGIRWKRLFSTVK
jgi:signal peptidase I